MNLPICDCGRKIHGYDPDCHEYHRLEDGEWWGYINGGEIGERCNSPYLISATP